MFQFSHFTSPEAEAQRGWVTSTKSIKESEASNSFSKT